MKALTQRVNRTLDTLRAVPGVEGAATSATLPGVPGEFQTELKFPEARDDASRTIRADTRFVSTGYFDVMRIPLLEGEACRDAEGTTGVVVNRSFARRFFPTMPALGHHLVFGANTPFSVTGDIRGIVADAREQGLNSEPMPTVYWCMSAPEPDPHYVVRTHRDPLAMAETLRRTIVQVEPGRSVFDLMPLRSHLSDAFAEDRMRTVLLSMFALTAVSLACVGLYGTLSYFVTLRRREIGLRSGVGCGSVANCAQIHVARTEGRIDWLRLRPGFSCGGRQAALGHVVRRIQPRHQTFAGVILLMFVVAAIAALLPAWRASRTDPMRVLRDE